MSKIIQIAFSPCWPWKDRDGYEEIKGGDLYALDDEGKIWRREIGRWDLYIESQPLEEGEHEP